MPATFSSAKTGNGAASRTSITLTPQGHAALDQYTSALRGILDGI